MAEKQIVDARGLSCPRPVLMTKKAVEKGGKSYEVIVDNGTAKENVTRFAQNAGFQVKVTEDGDDYHLTLSK